MSASAIFSRLRHGVPSEERGRAFDTVSVPTYALIGIAAACTIAVMIALGFTIEIGVLVYAIWPLWLWLGGILAKRVGHHRLGTAAEATGLLYGAAFVFIFLVAMVTAIAANDADTSLIRADAMLHFDWRDVAKIAERHQDFLVYLTAAYRSFAWQPAAIIALLAATSKTDRIWSFVLAWFVALSIIAVIHPMFPAQGPMVYYGIVRERFPGLLSDGPWTFWPIIHDIRDNGVRYLSDRMLTGLVTFPSFHVAGAIILARAAWPIRFAGPLFLALNIVMASAAIICGPHYLVDAIAGGIVAAISIFAAEALVSRVAERRA